MPLRKNAFTNEYFLSRIQELHKTEDYDILSSCENSRSVVKIKHKKCGKEFDIMAKEFVRGDGKDTKCPHCYKTHIWTLEECQAITQQTRPQYTVLDLYVDIVDFPNAQKRRRHLAMLKVCCNICQHTWDVRLEAFIHRGDGCPVCARKAVGKMNSFTLDDVKNRIYERVGNEYHLTKNSQYISYNGPIEMIHEKCGTIYHPILSEFLRPEPRCEQRCPMCHGRVYSVGESLLENIFQSLSIAYEKQKRFADCKNVHPLPFDFYLPAYNACIEFDGIQHYQVVEGWGGEDGLKDRQYWDAYKDNYCHEHNINILRIRFDQINDMQKIIEEYLSALQKNKLSLDKVQRLSRGD